MRFSSKKLLELGFEYKYSMEEMFDEAIQSCINKKLIPLQTVETTIPVCEWEKLGVIGEQVAMPKDLGSEEKVPIASH